MQHLKDKVAIVTGGSRGIGRCIAIRLAERGANISIGYRFGETEAKDVIEEILEAYDVNAVAIQSDIAQKREARALVKEVHERWGRVDILVNNAGVTRDKSMKNLTDEDWEEVLATNLGGTYATCSEVWPIMVEQNYGRIINISSFVGQAGNFGQANYAASKGAVIAFTKTMALELAKYDITVNAVAPGFTETEMLARVPQKVRDKILARVPMGRFGQPDEVARVVAFIVAEGDYITGQQINVNGGVYM